MVGVTPLQCKGARAMLGISRADLASAAGIAERTLIDFERGARSSHPNNIEALRRALEEAGAIFLDESEDFGAGLRLRKGIKARETLEDTQRRLEQETNDHNRMIESRIFRRTRR